MDRIQIRNLFKYFLLPDSSLLLIFWIIFNFLQCFPVSLQYFPAILPSTPAISLEWYVEWKMKLKQFFYRASKIWLTIRTKTQRKHFLSPSAMCVGYFMQITQFNVLPEIIFLRELIPGLCVWVSEVPLGSCLRRDTHSCDSHNIPWQSDFDGYTFGTLNHRNAYRLRGRSV